jgi:hypothetical protein
MSAATTRRFLPILRTLERELSAPIPQRVRILRELEHDLEGLRERYVAAGLTPAEAEAKALEALVPDSGALRELSRLHTPLYGRITRGLGEDRVRIAERSAFALATAAVMVFATPALLRTGLLRDPSAFLWPVLALGGVLAALIVGKGFEMWIKRDHRAADRGLGVLMGLSALVLVVAVAGALVDLIRLAAALERAPELSSALLLPSLVRDCALLAVAILVTAAGGLTWFVLTQWLGAVRAAQRDVLGLER